MRKSLRRWTAMLFIILALPVTLLLSTDTPALFAQSEDIYVYQFGPDIVSLDEEITYEIVVTNYSAETLTDLLIYDFIPPGTYFLGADSGGFETTDGYVVWDSLGDLPPGYEITVSFAVAPLGTGVVVNEEYGVFYGLEGEADGLWSIETLVVEGGTIDPEEPAVIEGSNANLSIDDFTLSWDSSSAFIDAVITNNGSETAYGPFYVDVFINPLQTVTGGKDWTEVGSSLSPKQGIEWEIESLAPGASIALTTYDTESGALFPLPEYTEWAGQLIEGTTTLVMYVDSWAENGSANGLVAESDESDNRATLTLDDAVPTVPGEEPEPEPSTPTPGGDPKFETAIGFRPTPHGYPFENWGGYQYDDSTDLDTATMIRLFGAANVCHSGSTPEDCVLKAAARQWRTAQLDGVRGGHCYGFAVSGQRFFAGIDAPGNYQAGATSAWELQPSVPVRAHITEYMITQYLSPADGSDDGWIRFRGYKPSQILNLIREQFQTNPDDIYMFGFLQEGAGGHAVTPYAIENRGGGIYWLYVYDNNYPGETRYIEFDVNRETWVYNFAATDPSVPPRIWQGDARTDSIWLRPTSAHLSSGWACPFCQETSTVTGASIANTSVGFELFGLGEILILDAEGRAVGYDFQRNQRINQIEGSIVIKPLNGTGVQLPPAYRLPQSQTGEAYTVYTSGATVSEPVDADLLMTGPGFAVGLEYLQINPGEDLLMAISPNGRRISFNASEAGTVTPNIYLALDPDPAGDSYIFGVGGFQLEAFKTVVVELDLANGLLLFSDDDGNVDSYALDVLRIRPDGTEQIFSAADVELGGESDASLNFGSWTGEDMSITIDGQEQTLSNTANSGTRVFLPYVTAR